MPVVLRKRPTRGGGKSFGVAIDMDEWAPDLDAIRLNTAVAEAVAEHHRKAINAGEKADGSGPQPPLRGKRQIADVAAGKRPNKRGVTNKRAFPNSIKVMRSATRSASREASRDVKVVGAVGPYSPWLAREEGRGVQYLYTEGEVEQAVDRAIEAEIDRVIAGQK